MWKTRAMEAYAISMFSIFMLRTYWQLLQVTGEAQGDEKSLGQFVQHLNKGPSAARVSNVEKSDIATKEGEKGFSEWRLLLLLDGHYGYGNLPKSAWKTSPLNKTT
jgi:hypothetical protein